MLQCGRGELPARVLKPGDFQYVHDDHTDWVTQVQHYISAALVPFSASQYNSGKYANFSEEFKDMDYGVMSANTTSQPCTVKQHPSFVSDQVRGLLMRL